MQAYAAVHFLIRINRRAARRPSRLESSISFREQVDSMKAMIKLIEALTGFLVALAILIVAMGLFR